MLANVECGEISTQPIREYSFLYPSILKLGLIELDGGPMATRMQRFLDRTYEKWYMSAPATILAALCFSGAPPKDVLKNLRDRDRLLALKGLRNCAWDLTYLSWWGELVRRQGEENCLYLFCSFDKALRRVARHMLVETDVADDEIEQALRQLLGSRVYDHYAELLSSQNDPARTVNQVGFDAEPFGTQLTADLESELRRRS